MPRKLHIVKSPSLSPTADALPLDTKSSYGSRSIKVFKTAAWPIALLLVFHRVVIVALNGTTTDDFTTVHSAMRRFLQGIPVYEQDYTHVDPLYLYNPGATLLLSPLGWMDLTVARCGFIVVNALAIIGALAVLIKLVGRNLRSPVFPASIILAFATEAVTNTLAFTNINGILFLAMAVFLWGILDSHRRSHIIAGLVLGLAILIKPQFGPLLFLTLVKKRWLSAALSIAVPVIFNAVAWPLTPGASGYLDKLVPYLGQTRDFANSSWPGVQAYFGLGDAPFYAVWLAAAAACAFSILGLLKWRDTEPVFWALTTSGAIMAGIFFLSSLGQQYYSMWLIPLVFTVFLPRSVFHTVPAWCVAFLFLAPVKWTSVPWPTAGYWMAVFSATIGWGLLIVLIAASVAGWWRQDETKV